MANPSEQPAMITLLQTLSSSGCVSELQLVKGFQRVVNQLGDTALDMPHARERFAELVAAAKEGGWLDDGFAATPGVYISAYICAYTYIYICMCGALVYCSIDDCNNFPSNTRPLLRRP